MCCVVLFHWVLSPGCGQGLWFVPPSSGCVIVLSGRVSPLPVCGVLF